MTLLVERQSGYWPSTLNEKLSQHARDYLQHFTVDRWMCIAECFPNIMIPSLPALRQNYILVAVLTNTVTGKQTVEIYLFNDYGRLAWQHLTDYDSHSVSAMRAIEQRIMALTPDDRKYPAMMNICLQVRHECNSRRNAVSLPDSFHIMDVNGASASAGQAAIVRSQDPRQNYRSAPTVRPKVAASAAPQVTISVPTVRLHCTPQVISQIAPQVRPPQVVPATSITATLWLGSAVTTTNPVIPRPANPIMSQRERHDRYFHEGEWADKIIDHDEIIFPDEVDDPEPAVFRPPTIRSANKLAKDTMSQRCDEMSQGFAAAFECFGYAI